MQTLSSSFEEQHTCVHQLSCRLGNETLASATSRRFGSLYNLIQFSHSDIVFESYLSGGNRHPQLKETTPMEKSLTLF
eukprot:873550-Karenia_brevis.AAC.1